MAQVQNLFRVLERPCKRCQLVVGNGMDYHRCIVQWYPTFVVWSSE